MLIIPRILLLPFYTAEEYGNKFIRGETFLLPDLGLTILRVSAYDKIVVQSGYEEQIGLTTYLGFAEEDRILAKTRIGKNLLIFLLR